MQNDVLLLDMFIEMDTTGVRWVFSGEKNIELS